MITIKGWTNSMMRIPSVHECKFNIPDNEINNNSLTIIFTMRKIIFIGNNNALRKIFIDNEINDIHWKLPSLSEPLLSYRYVHDK